MIGFCVLLDALLTGFRCYALDVLFGGVYCCGVPDLFVCLVLCCDLSGLLPAWLLFVGFAWLCFGVWF